MSLRDELADLGFIDVTGSLEGFGKQKTIIPVQEPTHILSIDGNNGMTVVVDETGHSWVISQRVLAISKTLDKIHDLESKYNLDRGAYVPHSNDGGGWAVSMWPWAYRTYHIGKIEEVEGVEIIRLKCQKQEDDTPYAYNYELVVAKYNDPRICHACTKHPIPPDVGWALYYEKI